MSHGDLASHLRDTAELLWAEPFRCALEGARQQPAAGMVEEYIVVPNASRPRLLLPAPSRVAAAVAAAHRSGGSRAATLKEWALSGTLRSGLSPRVFGDRLRVYGPQNDVLEGASITHHLSAVFNTPVKVAMPLTRPRANRKPVLRVVDSSGETRGFVKVGTNALTKGLVGSEGRALSRLAGTRFDHFDLPEVLALHPWRQLDLLVLAALPVRRHSANPSPSAMASAARELAAFGGTADRLLVGSPYWQRLRARLAAVQDERAAAVLRAMDRLAPALDNQTLAFGAWHGDWAPWNMAWDGDRVLVWDFERFEGDVPLGMDLVHYDLQTRILVPDRSPDDVIAARYSEAEVTLRPMGSPPSHAEVVFVSYLLDISARWMADRQGEAGNWNRLLDGLTRSCVITVDRLVRSLGDAGSRSTR